MEKLIFSLELLTVMFSINYILLLVPFISWDNIYHKAISVSNYYDSRLSTTLSIISGMTNFFYAITNYFIVIQIMTNSIMITLLSDSTTTFRVLTGLGFINLLVSVYYYILSMESSFEGGVSPDEGFLDVVMFKFLLKLTYKATLPKDIYQIVTLYYFTHLDRADISGYDSLMSNAHDFSNKILALWNKDSYREDINKFLLQPKNVSVLASISNVLTDDTKLEFIESSIGRDSRKVYISCLKDLTKEMTHFVVPKEIDIDDSQSSIKAYNSNVELISELEKAKNNNFYIV